jgi:anti-sigma regulatory factor (Ser/Thr protein kinase)
VNPRHIELQGALTLDDVPHVRRFVERIHRGVVHNDEAISRLAMATHELLENAVKFSVDGGATLRIDIDDDSRVCITTRNRAAPEDLADLRAIASQLEDAPNPMVVYLSLMRRAPTSRGGLGLGRVAAEADMQIGLELDGDVVQIQARTELVA